jgi:3-phosphoshikimate 1-carboxyvinyltransferase
MGVVQAPASKSLTNRLLVIAALADGESRLGSPLRSDDTSVMAAGLTALGASVRLAPDAAIVSGRSGRLDPPAGVVWAGLSGTTLRFLAGVSLLVPGQTVLDGEPPLRRRPIRPLLDALAAAGAVVTSDDGRPPLTIESDGLAGGLLEVDARESSQFATALLLVAPYARAGVTLDVANTAAGGYLDLTIEVMRRFGAVVDEVGPGRYVVSAAHRYAATDVDVEYDASAAAHLYALAVATRGSVTVSNGVASAQPDAGIVPLLEQMGADVAWDASGTGVTVRGGASLTGIDVDLGAMPDQVPTLAVLGALCEGRTVLRGIGVTRGHETDRIEAVAAELRRVGAGVETGPDWLAVDGGRPLGPARIETYDDHRMAMAFTALAAAVPGTTIASPGCVAKTYPDWWEDVVALGLGVEPLGSRSREA